MDRQPGYLPVAGKLVIADEVIADLAGYTAFESYGVVGMAAPSMQDGIAKLLPVHRLRRGVLVHSTDEGILVDMYVIIESGTNLGAVSKNLADSVRYVLEHFAQIPVADVRIHVQGIRMPESR